MIIVLSLGSPVEWKSCVTSTVSGSLVQKTLLLGGNEGRDTFTISLRLVIC